MPTAIDATIGGAAANSYITVAEGTSYADDVLGTLNWTTASTDNRTRALLAATARLDELSWIGERAATTQSLAWPRSAAECGEHSYTTSEIPAPVKRACWELAELLLGDADAFSTVAQVTGELVPGIPNANLRSASLGNGALDLEFKDGGGAPLYRNALNVLPSLVPLLGCLCTSAPASSVGTVRLVRG